jgi:hypothetical protein
MVYPQSMTVAANRHYRDGLRLMESKCFDNAGYHFGLAGECAIKQKLLDCGCRTDEPAYWKHLPDLRMLACQSLSGRKAGPIRALLEQSSFLQHWDISMRYSIDGEVAEKQAGRWRDDANEAIGLLL